MPDPRRFRFRFLLACVLVASCSRGFKVARYSNNDALFRAGLSEFQRKKWDHAVTAFEKLTFDLPARDTLLPLAHWYLARAHSERGEHLLAAQAFARLSESFATDSLADDALFRSGREYQSMWRRPTLDASYGYQALETYQTMLSLYPDSELIEKTNEEIRRLYEWFATKYYEVGMYYIRRKAFDSAIIYLKDVVTNYPQTERARDAYLRLAEAYGTIRYKEDKAEVCATLHERYPKHPEVLAVCGPPPVIPVKGDTSAAVRKP